MYDFSGAGQNPFATLRLQLEGQLKDLENMEREAAQQQQRYSNIPQLQAGTNYNLEQLVNTQVERYLQQVLPQYLPQQQPHPTEAMASIVEAIETSLNKEDVDLLVGNTAKISGYIQTKEGQKSLQNFMNGFKKSLAEKPAEENKESS